MATKVTVLIHPNGSYGNYVAYGKFDSDGKFKRAGYPKNILKATYGSSWGKRDKASYEYEISFEVPADFQYAIVKVGSGKQTNGDIDILYPQAATYYHGTDDKSAQDIIQNGMKRGAYVSGDFQWAVYYALMHFVESAGKVAVVAVSAQAIAPIDTAFDGERIVIGKAARIGKYTPRFTSIPTDWMEPNDDVTSQRYSELFSKSNWDYIAVDAEK